MDNHYYGVVYPRRADNQVPVEIYDSLFANRTTTHVTLRGRLRQHILSSMLQTPFLNGVSGEREEVPVAELDWQIVETHRQKSGSNDCGVHVIIELLYHWINHSSGPLSTGCEFVEYEEEVGSSSGIVAGVIEVPAIAYPD